MLAVFNCKRLNPFLHSVITERIPVPKKMKETNNVSAWAANLLFCPKQDLEVEATSVS